MAKKKLDPKSLNVTLANVPLTDIIPAAYNPRKDLKPGDPEYEKLKVSIFEFGMVDPIVWNKQTGNLVGGHQRYKILLDMGIKIAQVSVVDLPLHKEMALNIALNKISGDWDMPKLKDVLFEIDTGSFDITITGFDIGEIEDLMTQFNPVDGDTQPRLDEKAKVKCPECGCEFTPAP